MKRLTTNKAFLLVKSTRRELKRHQALKKRKFIKARKRKARDKQRKIHINNRISCMSRIAKVPSNFFKELGTKKRLDLGITIPEKFSICENTEETLIALSSLAQIECSKRLRLLSFDHRKCKSHDLAAEIMLGGIVSDLRFMKKINHQGLRIQGKFPKDNSMSRLIHSVGVVQEIHAQSDHQGEESKIRLSKGQGHAEPTKIFELSTKVRVVEKLVEHVRASLEKFEQEFTEWGKSKITEILSELIDNAEDHTQAGYWYAASYLDLSQDLDTNTSQLVLYNFGDTFSETLGAKINDPNVFEQEHKDYLDRHSRSHNRDELLTILCLQQFMSSKNEDNLTRGQGLMDLLHFLVEIATKCYQNNGHSTFRPELCIISGRVCMKIDGTYKPSEDLNGYYTYFMNEENSPLHGPDPTKIFQMSKAFFPGTIISLNIPLTPLLEGKHETK